MIDHTIHYLNTSPLFAGCIMILMNIGSRYISYDIPKSVDGIFQNIWLRRFIVFCIAFVATHDIKTSILITLMFIIIFNYLLDEKKKTYILPETYFDLNNDGKVTKEEYEKAKMILQQYQEKK